MSGTIRGELAVVRRAGGDDVDRLVAWHADPDVSRYWDDETPGRSEILDRLAAADVEAYVVEANGEPVGYLQAWFEAERCGLDGFLVPGARGRGLMPDAARALARDLRARGRREVTVDPYTWNEAAVRAWAKAGFAPVEERPADEEHASTWLLMRFDDS